MHKVFGVLMSSFLSPSVCENCASHTFTIRILLCDRLYFNKIVVFFFLSKQSHKEKSARSASWNTPRRHQTPGLSDTGHDTPR